MLRPEMKLFEHSEFSSQALLLIRFQILYFSQIPEWNKDPASRISVPFYPGNSEFFPVFLNSSSFRQIYLPDPKDMLEPQAYQGDSRPAAESGKDWFASGLYQFNDVCVQTNGSHCHNNKKLTQAFQRGGYCGGKLKESCYN